MPKYNNLLYGNRKNGHDLLVNKHGYAVGKQAYYAIAYLLWQTACIDGNLHPYEESEISYALYSFLSLSNEQVEHLIRLSAKNTGKYTSFMNAIQTINLSYDNRKKRLIMDLVCKVAMADRKIHKNETSLVRQIKKHLGFTPVLSSSGSFNIP